MEKGYRTQEFKYDLTTAENKFNEECLGHRVQVISVSDLSAEIKVSFKSRNNSLQGDFPLKVGGHVQIPEEFDSVNLSWDAQAGVEVTLLIIDMDPAPKEFSYNANDLGTLEGISQAVTIAEAGSIVSGSTTVNTSAVEITALSDQHSITLTNKGTDFCLIGDASSQDTPFEVDEKVTIKTNASIWLKCNSGSQPAGNIKTAKFYRA